MSRWRRPLLRSGFAAVLVLTTAWAATTGRLASLRTLPERAPTAAPRASGLSAATSNEAADDDGRLYAIAREAHFVARDPDKALRAWDAYLAAHPSGRFALEARFNRALTLVRLGRLDDARRALTPFASGEAGGYRQREARELLDAMQ